MKRFLLLLCLPITSLAHEVHQCEVDLQSEPSIAPEQSSQRVYEADTLKAARNGFATRYGFRATDCDPVIGGWLCSDVAMGSSPSSQPEQPLGAALPDTDDSETSSYGLYEAGDLISLHHDFAPDPDDLQAIIANRELLDEHDVDYVVVAGTLGYRFSELVPGSISHTRSLFPEALDAFGDHANSVQRVASLFQATLATGNSVWIAEGGPSDFTSDVIRELQKRRVTGLKRIHVVQHSDWNRNQTNPVKLNHVQHKASWIRIEDGNHSNATAGLKSGQGGHAFKRNALNSLYSAQWDFALTSIDQKVDFSDTVELLHILGISKSAVPSPDGFAERFF